MSANQRTIMKSFRLSCKTTDLLSKTARQMGMSENAYVSKVLNNRLKIEKLTQNFGEIELSERLFQEILAQANPARLEILASEFAQKNIPFVFEILNLELNVASVLWYVSEMLQPSGWFKAELVWKEEEGELKLFHNFGIRWSLFVKSYLLSTFEFVIRKRVEVTVGDRVVKVALNAESDDFGFKSTNVDKHQNELETNVHRLAKSNCYSLVPCKDYIRQ